MYKEKDIRKCKRMTKEKREELDKDVKNNKMR
jgi:hypothetical protein